MINNGNKHLQFRDLTSFNTQSFELIQFDNTFLVEPSETSDTSNIISETSFTEYDQNTLQSDPNQIFYFSFLMTTHFSYSTTTTTREHHA